MIDDGNTAGTSISMFGANYPLVVRGRSTARYSYGEAIAVVKSTRGKCRRDQSYCVTSRVRVVAAVVVHLTPRRPFPAVSNAWPGWCTIRVYLARIYSWFFFLREVAGGSFLFAPSRPTEELRPQKRIYLLLSPTNLFLRYHGITH